MSRNQASLDNWITQVKRSHTPSIDKTQLNLNITNNKPTTTSTTSTANNSIKNPNKRQKGSFQQSKLSTNTCLSHIACPNNIHWGHDITSTSHPASSIRIAMRNVNSLPTKLPDSRHDSLVHDITSAHIDIMGMVETNITWQKIPAAFQPNQRFKENFEHVNTIFSNNTTNLDICDTRQPGGTMILSLSSMCSRAFAWGTDPTKLGRWTWVRYKGKHCTLRVICTYRPVYSHNINGSYQQQLNYFLMRGESICPRKKFLQDLSESITLWQKSGDLLIIMGDFNEPINGSCLQSFFTSLQLKEAILSNHKALSPPNTF
jgi:exonuclease III